MTADPRRKFPSNIHNLDKLINSQKCVILLDPLTPGLTLPSPEFVFKCATIFYTENVEDKPS